MSLVHRVFLAAGHYGATLFWTGAMGAASPLLYAYFRACAGMLPGRAMREIIWVYGRGWSLIFRFFTPTEFTGKDRDPPHPAIFVLNHQSFFDAYFMGAFNVPDVVFVVRSWPFRIPFYGFFMRGAGYIDAEAMSAGEFVAACGKLLQNGTSVAVFPEGTRSFTREMGRFRSGAFVLSLETGVPIVPICLAGTGVFLRRGEFLPRKTTVRVCVLDPLFPEDYEPYGNGAHRMLRRETKARLQNALEPQPTETPMPLFLPAPVGDLLPHEGRMRCIDTLLHEEGSSAVAAVTLKPGHALVTGGVLDRAGFIELAAQAIGARQGYVRKKRHLLPGAGFLVGAQSFAVFQDAREGDTLEIFVQRIGEFRGVSVIAASVRRNGEEIAAGRLKVFEPSSNDAKG